jgi:hypothetical protein
VLDKWSPGNEAGHRAVAMPPNEFAADIRNALKRID